MSCHHKFIRDLNLDRIDFEPTTLIVGTFIPVWPANTAEWFYGRTHDANGNRSNNFWDILPRIYGAASLIGAAPAEWKQFCHDKRIAITDMISSIDDADPENHEHRKILTGSDDKAIVFHFDDFVFVNIVQLLRTHPTIRNVYLTRGVTEAFWKHVWNPVMQYCNLNDLHERKLLTPSGHSLYQHEAYNNEHPDQAIPLLEDYILMRWQQEWHIGSPDPRQ
jgi:hypothetical protein